MPAYKFGIIYDFLGWFIKYENGNWTDVIHSFGYKGLHPFFHCINFGFYNLFGLNVFGWHTAFTVLHGVNAFLLFSLLNKLFNDIKVEQGSWIAGLSCAGFLLGPYQVEVVCWEACLHYVLTVLLFLSSALLLREYIIVSRSIKIVIWHHLLFICALFTLEVNLAVPFILLVFAWLYMFNGQLKFLKYFKLFFLPQLLLLVGYFMLNRWVLGDWVGHYGASNHFNFSASLLLGNGFKYFFKYGLFAHFWEYPWRHSFYGALEQVSVSGPLFLLAVLSAGFLFFKRDVVPKRLIIAAAFLVMFFMAIFPIVNLYFMYLVHFENDRYGYFASIFFMPFIFSLFFGFRPMLKWSLVIIFLSCSFVFGMKRIFDCKTAAEITQGLIDSYEWSDEPNVKLLALPDNYRGVYVFRDLNDGEAETFREALDLFKGREHLGKINEIAQYNQEEIDDAFKIEFEDSETMKIKFAQFKNWFWRRGVGFVDFENEDRKASIDRNAIIYQSKDSLSDVIYIIPEGRTWKKVEW